MTRLRRVVKQARAVALSQGHVLGPFKKSDGDYVAWCRRCESLAVIHDAGIGPLMMTGPVLDTQCGGEKV
jgi:hypothetical protein